MHYPAKKESTEARPYPHVFCLRVAVADATGGAVRPEEAAGADERAALPTAPAAHALQAGRGRLRIGESTPSPRAPFGRLDGTATNLTATNRSGIIRALKLKYIRRLCEVLTESV